MGGVVVGMSHHSDSTPALAWASAEATRRGLPLRLVHAWPAPLGVDIALGVDALPDLHAPATAQALPGHAGRVLLGEAPDLLVLGGHTGAPHPTRLLRFLLHHATCPVVVVPDQPHPPTGRVLAAVTGTDRSRTTLRWAADHAHRCLADLVVVHAWQQHPSDLLHPGRDSAAQARTAQQELAEWVHRALGDTDVDIRAAHGAPLDTLLHLSGDADLIVLGRRRATHHDHGLHGSLSADLAALAPCPIAIIPSS